MELPKLPPHLETLYRVTSGLWLVVSVALGLTAWGSTLLSGLEPGRQIVTGLAVLMGLAMLLRMVVPGRPDWTAWTLPLMASTSVATCTLVLFAVDLANLGYTPARIGYALLILSPAFFAYIHWIGERKVLLHKEKVGR